MTVYDDIAFECGPVVPALSRCLRSMLVAGPGNKLVGGDFANIEGRINAWMAGEQWKLDAFRAYDAGTGPDLYVVMAANALGIAPAQVTKLQRQTTGKVPELACGYQGSVGAWLRFDPTPTTVTQVIRDRFFGSDEWKKAGEQYDRTPIHLGLSADSWVAIKTLVNIWRRDNPRIVQSWWDRQDAAIEAVDAPGTIVPVMDGKVRYLVADGFLWGQTPSGKLLAYANPHLVEKREEWLVDADGEMVPCDELTADEIELRKAAGMEHHVGRSRTQVAFEGRNQKTGAWGRQYMYGGLQTNNDVQLTARELLRLAIGRVEAAGYPVNLHVHDELVAEVRQEFGSPEHFEGLMSVLPSFMEGLPLAAKAWVDQRYVK